MVIFLIGLWVGALLGVLVAALLRAASEPEHDPANAAGGVGHNSVRA
jgi:hypothetical protein